MTIGRGSQRKVPKISTTYIVSQFWTREFYFNQCECKVMCTTLTVRHSAYFATHKMHSTFDCKQQRLYVILTFFSMEVFLTQTAALFSKRCHLKDKGVSYFTFLKVSERKQIRIWYGKRTFFMELFKSKGHWEVEKRWRIRLTTNTCLYMFSRPLRLYTTDRLKLSVFRGKDMYPFIICTFEFVTLLDVRIQRMLNYLLNFSKLTACLQPRPLRSKRFFTPKI